MSSVLKQLYYGNITPDSRHYGPNSPFVEAAQLKATNLEQLMTLLSEQGQEVFEKYCEAQADMEGITRYNTFTYALKFGMLLMTEIFMGRSEITGAEECL